jgi:hypothetical protein
MYWHKVVLEISVHNRHTLFKKILDFYFPAYIFHFRNETGLKESTAVGIVTWPIL